MRVDLSMYSKVCNCKGSKASNRLILETCARRRLEKDIGLSKGEDLLHLDNLVHWSFFSSEPRARSHARNFWSCCFRKLSTFWNLFPIFNITVKYLLNLLLRLIIVFVFCSWRFSINCIKF